MVKPVCLHTNFACNTCACPPSGSPGSQACGVTCRVPCNPRTRTDRMQSGAEDCVWVFRSLFADPCWNLKVIGLALAVILAMHQVCLIFWVKLGQEAMKSQSRSVQRCASLFQRSQCVVVAKRQLPVRRRYSCAGWHVQETHIVLGRPHAQRRVRQCGGRRRGHQPAPGWRWR